MSLFSFLAHSLRAMGHEEAAADVERGGGGGGPKKRPYELEDDDSPRAAPAQSAAITPEHSGGHDSGGGAPERGGGGAGGGAESGSGAGAGGDHGAGAGGASGGSSSESVSAPAGGSAGGEKVERAKPAADVPAEPKPEQNLSDDPTAGLHSERLKERLHHDAARGASSIANDSEIHRLADRARGGPSTDEKLFPSHLLDKFTAKGSINLDTSPTAQAGRIAALGGEIPSWAQGDPQNDPSLIRSAERGAAPERTAAGAAPAPERTAAGAAPAPAAAPSAAHAGAAVPARER